MTYKLLYLPHVYKILKKMDPGVKAYIKKALEKISSDPYTGKGLSDDLKGCYSLRTGSYRIIYEINNKEIHVLVVAIGHRREVYEKLRHLLK